MEFDPTDSRLARSSLGASEGRVQQGFRAFAIYRDLDVLERSYEKASTI
jgi:hypothetical protein